MGILDLNMKNFNNYNKRNSDSMFKKKLSDSPLSNIVNKLEKHSNKNIDFKSEVQKRVNEAISKQNSEAFREL